MGSEPNQTPLIVIVGETASGKTALAIELAKKFNGEIIAADSRTIYKGMDIGTAKPTIAEQDGIVHYLLDVVAPDQTFTAADFKQKALAAISQIASKGKVPIIVGGTGLYIDSILYDFSFGGAPDPKYRQQLQAKTVSQLQEVITKKHLTMPQNAKNPRHLIRVIESGGVISRPRVLRQNTLIIGLTIDREKLRQKLIRRVDVMVEAGLVDEVRRLSRQYSWDVPALQAPGYKAFHGYIDGAISLERAKELFVHNDMQLAKRQRTWFKRNKSIHWITEQDQAVDLVTTFLNK